MVEQGTKERFEVLNHDRETEAMLVQALEVLEVERALRVREKLLGRPSEVAEIDPGVARR